MSKEIYISSTPHETRLAIVEKDELTEIYYERENEYTLAGSIYKGRVTRVLPGMQSSFVDIGLERDAFLYITDFMEEAGDAADFDGTAGAETSAGPARGASAKTGEHPPRGRGRREPWVREDAADSETSAEEPHTFAPSSDEASNVTAEADEGEASGEGAPGANGSRRWRGRRGRRRGRAGNGDQGTAAPSAGEQVEAASPSGQIPSGVGAGRAPREERSARDDRNRGDLDRSHSGEAGSQRNGERGGRESRHDAGRERFAPGGLRGASRPNDWSLGEDRAPGAAAEPIVLPGESLAKYRHGDPAQAGGDGSHSAAESTAPVVKAKPSTEVEPLVGWDGGSVLPGETLSRYREAGPHGRSETGNVGQRGYAQQEREGSGERSSYSGPQSGRDRRLERDARRSNGGRGEAGTPDGSSRSQSLDPAEAVLPGVTSQHEVEEAALPLSEYAVDLQDGEAVTGPAIEIQSAENAAGEFDTEVYGAESTPAPDVAYEPETAAAPIESALPADAVIEAVQEFHETVAEYEPEEESSASYRVDPLGSSEFRQNLVAEEPGSVAAEHTGETAVDETSATPECAAEHAFTTVQATGELISELTYAEAEPGDAGLPGISETSPIEHETAVQSTSLDEAQNSTVPFAPGQGTAQGGTSLANFEPGDGQLEEELLDDDEGEIGAMQAGVFDDDTEEETLEMAGAHAPDLGSMIRDISIDEITRPETVEHEEEDEDGFDVDEDDLQEDDLQEDELESSSDEELESEEVAGSEISESQEEEFAQSHSLEEEAEESGDDTAVVESEGGGRPGRDSSHAQREERRGGRDRGGSGGYRDRRGITSSRPNGGGRDRGNRSMQTTHLPAISELLKPGQEVLVQIAKEPMAKKGARITSHIALPGRFLVFMPTVNHVGVSRKIESDGERRRLKEILLSEKGEAGGGFIVRTAASGASEEELRSDLRFLLNLWADIKQRSESSKSPALIYHDLNLVERILRDQVTDNFSAIWVDTESEYERVLRFLQRFQPGLIRRVKLYTKDTPLFEQFGISTEIDKALRSKVWLKSGGSIVINQTEALVAIDINTGKYVGKTARLEDTIVKTNLDAIPEIVRQIRLRDLGGIIIIDFIDMDERKNRNKVMAALEEELKRDRAPSKVLQFNDFGLVAITRKRVKQSLERTLSTTCSVCQGTGMTKSPVTVCNDIYIEMRKMHKIIEKGDIMLRVNPEVVKQLKSGSGRWLQEMEEMSGKTILVKSDPSLHPEQFDIH